MNNEFIWKLCLVLEVIFFCFNVCDWLDVEVVVLVKDYFFKSLDDEIGFLFEGCINCMGFVFKLNLIKEFFNDLVCNYEG